MWVLKACRCTSTLWVILPLLFIFGTITIKGVICRVPESALMPHDRGEDLRFVGGDDDYVQYNLKVPFAFFNKTYNELFVSPNGQVTFERGVSSYSPSCKASGTPVIMVYWSDVLWTVDRNTAKVLYRESRDPILLERVADDVFKGIPEHSWINLNWMFIVTYKDVPFYNATKCVVQGLNPDAPKIRNTFQLILTSDGTYSFAVMYYSKIEWTTGTASGGNCLGLKGQPAKAGFDYGDDKTLFTIADSCTNNIRYITDRSNINERGKFVFRIDSSLEGGIWEDIPMV